MYTTGGFSYKQYPHSNQLFVNQYLDANSQHFIKHSRGGSYDSTRTPQLVPSFNTPPKPNIFQNNNTREISEFFSETKAMKNKIFEEKNKTYFSPQKFRNGQLINEIVDYMENKKKIEEIKNKPSVFAYSSKIGGNNSLVAKPIKNESSPSGKYSQTKVDVSFDPFPKNQNLKRFIETQKVNKDREEDDVRATANFGTMNITKPKQEKLEAENKFKLSEGHKSAIGPQHKRIASSGFESFKHQENIDRGLLGDRKLYFDESPSFVAKKEKDYFDNSAIRFSYRTRKGYVINNPYKVNQDNFIMHSFLIKQSLCHLFVVCDGHGVFGHLVSYFIKQEFPNILRVNPLLETSPEKALYNSIKLLETLLEKSSIHLEISGSTLIVVLLIDNKLYCANVGDSRAILAHRQASFFSKWENIALSIDHKPELPKEAERITKAGGRIGAIQDYSGKPKGPKRVWRLKEDMPGLAMSRSMGDLIAKSLGVTWEPEIKDYTLDNKHKFMVVGSDGLWEFLSNEECTNIVGLFFLKNNLEGACDYLLNEAHQRWIKNDENCMCVDDITFIIIFFQNL